MSKLDKNIQAAREWLAKHDTETASAGVKKALAAWEAKVKRADALKAQVKTAKDDAKSARKDVSTALRAAKAARKAKPAAKLVKAPVKKAAPAKAAPKKAVVKKAPPAAP